jgi:hypothetical protein
MANHWHYCTGRGIDMVGQYVRKGLLMNDRIRELAEQATEVSEFLSGECCPPTPDLEKFTQLIVRECADIVKYYHTRNEAVTPQQILQHFGVEE